jgi:site-specific DNA-methyltransferase (adenine-specific)
MPKPYYQDKKVTIYHGDCREILPSIDPVTLILTDPPYFRVKNEAWDRAWADPAHFLAWLGSVADLWVECLTPDGSLYCFASPEMSAQVEVMLRARFHVLNRIRWVKRNGWHRKAEREALRRYLSPWEEIIFAEAWWSDGSADKESGYGDATRELHKRVYSPIAGYFQSERERAGLTRNEVEVGLGYVSSHDPSRGTALCCRWEEGSSLPTKDAYRRLRELLNKRGKGLYLRKEYEELRKEYEELRRPFNVKTSEDAYDIWHFDTVAPNAIKHPCQKPIDLLSYAIMKSTRPDAILLDSFMGTGATLEAARMCGRKAIGIEIEERYCEIAANRLAQETLF